MQIGILGGGQLGRMLALAGLPLNVRSLILEPAVEPCAGHISPVITGEFEDYQALYKLACESEIITYEFENVPVTSAHWLAERKPVFPPPEALAVAQDRLSEKHFFSQLGIPVAPFVAVNCREDYEQGIKEIGLPAVLKTTRFGYDGKGQAVVRNAEQVESAWYRLQGRPLILEGLVPFVRELSILSVRSRSGEMAFYPLVENVHREGILRRSIPLDNIPFGLQNKAEEIARKALNQLNYVGVLAIEMFQTGTDASSTLVVNEMAPRVHNSGHWTIEGAQTSQFENHLRAILGLPLGSCELRGYSQMFNLIGNLPPMEKILGIPGVHVHHYGKDPRAGRKVGHITVCGNTQKERNDRSEHLLSVLDLL